MRMTTRRLLVLGFTIFWLAACDNGSSGGDGESDMGLTPDGTTEQTAEAIEPNIASCSYPAIGHTDVLTALETGDAREVSETTSLIAATRDTITALRQQYEPTVVQLFNLQDNGTPRSDGSSLTAIDWDPRHDAALLHATFGMNAPVLVTNGSVDGEQELRGEALAVVGQTETSRYLVLGGNPFRTDPAISNSSVVNSQMDLFLKNGIGWLSGKSAEAQKKIVLAQLDESYYFRDESAIRSWLTDQFGNLVTVNDAETCNGNLLEGCLTADVDMLILSQHFDQHTEVPATIAAAVQQALDDGISVLYVQRNGGLNALGTLLFDLFGVLYSRDNHWPDLLIENFDGAQMYGYLPQNYQQIETALFHLQDGDYGFTLVEVAASPDDHQAYQETFAQGAEVMQDRLNGFDEAGIAVFEACRHPVEKLLVLLGDRLRQDIQYPMSILDTPTGEFLRAYFADHAVYNLRTAGAPQPDLGNFSPVDLSEVAGVSRSVQLTSRKHFRSTGAYLLPGQPARITRLDNNAVQTEVFVNTIRKGATHQWDEEVDAYPRPKFLQSAHIPLKPGESIIVTNPYGGPLQVGFDQSDVSVSLKFDNVGEHPHWRGSADDGTFAEKLATGLYHWVEVATPGFELHSRLDKFEETLMDPRWDTPAALAQAMDRYTYNEIHVLAGFQADDIDKRPEIYDWAISQGLTPRTLDIVKHGNMDQATCGYGCSGNPYDAYWDFSPIGHGDLHELGHGLQSRRFRLTHDGNEYGGHGTTNWYSFYTKSRYFEDHQGDVGNWSVPHLHLFEQLQLAYQAGEREGDFSNHMDAYLGAAILDGEKRNSYAFFIQAAMAAVHAGKLENGYHFIPRIHILLEAFNDATDSDALWTANRATLGFDGFSLSEAQSMTNNDFMFVALCRVTGLDYTDFFAMWGVAISDTARSQVASFRYPAVPRAFYAMNDGDHTQGALSTSFHAIPRLQIDGTTSWPLP